MIYAQCPFQMLNLHLLWRSSRSSWLLSSFPINGPFCRQLNLKGNWNKLGSFLHWPCRCSIQKLSSVYLEQWPTLKSKENIFGKILFHQDLITLLKLSSDSSGGHQDFLKILKMSLSHFCNILRFLSPCIPDLVQLNISLLSHVLRGRRCLEKINVTLKEAPMHWTDPPHHLVEADQLLLRSGHSHLLVGRRRTVESLHEVIRDPARLKRAQACNVWRK